MYLDKNKNEIKLGDTVSDKRFKGCTFNVVNGSDGKLHAYNGVISFSLKNINENFEKV